MAVSGVKNEEMSSPISKIFNHLVSSDYFKSIHSDILASIKESTSRKTLQDISKQNYMNLSSVLDEDSSVSAQNIETIHLSACGLESLVSELSEIVNRRLESERPVIEQKVKALMNCMQPDNIESHGSTNWEVDGNFIERTKNENNGSENESFMEGIESDSSSDSSVHTSQLSSFDDEISLSSEDEMGMKKKRQISLDTARLLLEATKSISLGNKSPLLKKTRSFQSCDSEPLCTTSTSTSAADSFHKSLPSRIRKPNSKYSSDDMISPVHTSSTNKSLSVGGRASDQVIKKKKKMTVSQNVRNKRKN